MHDNDTKERCNLAPMPLPFEYFICERDVNFYTGFSTIALFKTVSNHVAAKAHVMTYLEGQQSHFPIRKEHDIIITIVQPK